jgi:hypothetical protein
MYSGQIDLFKSNLVWFNVSAEDYMNLKTTPLHKDNIFSVLSLKRLLLSLI